MSAVHVTALAAPFRISLPAISKHLRVLENAQLLTFAQAGRNRICQLNPAPLQQAAAWLAHYRLPAFTPVAPSSKF